jgi:hypothetical protein
LITCESIKKAAGIRQDIQDIHGFLPGTISHYVQNMASNPKQHKTKRERL